MAKELDPVEKESIRVFPYLEHIINAVSTVRSIWIKGVKSHCARDYWRQGYIPLHEVEKILMEERLDESRIDLTRKYNGYTNKYDEGRRDQIKRIEEKIKKLSENKEQQP